MNRRLLYVFTHAPYSSAAGQEGLEAVLVGSAFEQQISLLFIHDGVYQLKAGQASQKGSLKQYTKTYAALHDFGVNEIYTHDLSLIARGINDDALMLSARSIDTEQVRALLAEQDKVFTF